MTAILRSCFVSLLVLDVLGCASGGRGRGAPEGLGLFGADASGRATLAKGQGQSIRSALAKLERDGGTSEEH